ncbi:hypothetical protein MKX03_022344, partial [Papaver bracteatum]
MYQIFGKRSPPCKELESRGGPLSKDLETSSWKISPLTRDSFSMVLPFFLFVIFSFSYLKFEHTIGSAVGGTASAFYGFNLVMPLVQRRIKGPMWLQFLIGTPLLMLFSSACAG